MPLPEILLSQLLKMRLIFHLYSMEKFDTLPKASSLVVPKTWSQKHAVHSTKVCRVHSFTSPKFAGAENVEIPK